MRKYNLIVCGGTFDHFHKGHREFLQSSFSLGRNIIIGLTSERYIKEKLPNEFVESYKKRKKAISDFLKKEKVLDKTKIISIDDIFGPTLLRNLKIDAIFVSQQSINGAESINKKRAEIGLSELKILIKPMVLGQDLKLISSSKIRQGIINREGKLFINPLWFSKKIILTRKIRARLKKPLGVLLKTINYQTINPNYSITVGDFVTKSFIDNKIYPKISVVDFYIERKKVFSNLSELGFLGDEKVIKIDNPAGYLTPLVFKKAYKIFQILDKNAKIVLKVNGEEDLCVLPLILASPLGFDIYYGQPQQGIVRIYVDEKIKEKTYNIVNNLDI